MQNIISYSELDSFKTMLDRGEYENFYESMSKHGYRYADWALGVVRGDTITGASAQDFLQGTAFMGVDAESSRNLTPEKSVIFIEAWLKDIWKSYTMPQIRTKVSLIVSLRIK